MTLHPIAESAFHKVWGQSLSHIVCYNTCTISMNHDHKL